MANKFLIIHNMTSEVALLVEFWWLTFEGVGFSRSGQLGTNWNHNFNHYLNLLLAQAIDTKILYGAQKLFSFKDKQKWISQRKSSD